MTFQAIKYIKRRYGLPLTYRTKYCGLNLLLSAVKHTNKVKRQDDKDNQPRRAPPRNVDPLLTVEFGRCCGRARATAEGEGEHQAMPCYLR
jgi:hypothetical protein